MPSPIQNVGILDYTPPGVKRFRWESIAGNVNGNNVFCHSTAHSLSPSASSLAVGILEKAAGRYQPGPGVRLQLFPALRGVGAGVSTARGSARPQHSHGPGVGPGGGTDPASARPRDQHGPGNSGIAEHRVAG